MEEELYTSEIKKAYGAQSLVGFSNGLYSPFMNIFAVERGLTYGQLGLFRSVGNIMPNLLQPLFGGLSDRFGKRKLFAAIGYGISALLVPLFLFTSTPFELILLYGLLSLFTSMALPTWNSLISLIIPEKRRGAELGKLSTLSSLCSLASTIIAGILMTTIALGGNTEEYTIPFYIASVTGIIAAILTLVIKEPEYDSKNTHFPHLLKILSTKGYFRRFLFVSIMFAFSMSMAWPYFAVILVDFQHASKFAISLHMAFNMLPMVLFQSYFGRLADKIGRKPLLLASRLMLPIIPLVYVFAPNMNVIYVAAFFAGISMAMGFNAALAYTFDVSPPEERGSYVAAYNFTAGIAFFFGSLIGGFLGDIFTVNMGLIGAVIAVMSVSSILRLFSGVLYFSIKEPKQYDSSFKEEVCRQVKRFLRIHCQK